MTESAPRDTDTDTERFIEIADVTKAFGAVRAVDDVTVHIKQGEFFSLLGASGCGKTTLLRMLAGFDFPTRGDILIDGQPMAAVPPHKRPTNMVFQNYAIFPHLNVGENIAYGLRKLKLDRAEKRRRVEQALEMIKMPGYADRGSDQLSGGQRQRVALARALIRQPKVLLLDEPLGALDKRLREEMQLELGQLQADLGITFVFVTHDQEEAMTMSDRIAVMAEGKVLQIADPHALYERPSSAAVARFIGTMNFLEATVRGREADRIMVDARGLGTVGVPVNGAAPADGSKVLVAIRPEKFSLSAPALGDSEDGSDGVRGSVAASAYLGDRSHYFVALPEVDRPLAVSAQNVDRRIEGWLDAGEPVQLTWRPDALLLLPYEEMARA